MFCFSPKYVCKREAKLISDRRLFVSSLVDISPCFDETNADWHDRSYLFPSYSPFNESPGLRDVGKSGYKHCLRSFSTVANLSFLNKSLHSQLEGAKRQGT